MPAIQEIEISPLLQSCFLKTETACVRECCGIDAFEPVAEVVRKWSTESEPRAAEKALSEIRNIIALCQVRSFVISSLFLNACTPDEPSREKLITFLREYEVALSACV